MNLNDDDNEISLKELIIILLKGKRTILWVTLFVILLAGVYAFFIADEVFEASVEGTIVISETASSKFGDYTFPSVNITDYLNVAKSDEVIEKVITNLNLQMNSKTLEDKITIISEPERSSFEFKVRAKDKVLSERIINELSNVYLETINMKYKKFAVEHFLRDYFVKVRTVTEDVQKQEKSLEGLKAQLDQISPTITLQKLVTSDSELASKIASERGVSLESLSNEVMYEQISNPSYEKLSESVMAAESALVELNSALEYNTKLYEELVSEENAIKQYYEDGAMDALSDGSLDLMKSRVSVSSYIDSSDAAVSPNKVLILVIGLMLGLMLGVFVTFFKTYWMNS